jgi:hypothetical protein
MATKGNVPNSVNTTEFRAKKNNNKSKFLATCRDCGWTSGKVSRVGKAYKLLDSHKVLKGCK